MAKEELSFYSAESNGKTITLIDPTHYPEKIQPLLHSLSMADMVVLIVDGLTPKVGELLVAVNAMKIDNGIIITSTPLPLGGMVLDKYAKVASMDEAKAKVLSASAATPGENSLAMVHKTANVKSLGNVAFSVIKSGSFKKSDKLFALPLALDVEIRSIHASGTGAESDDAKCGSLVEVAYKGDLFERGILVPLRHDFEVGTVVNGKFNKSPFYKDEIKGRVHAYTNMQFVEGTVTDNDITLSAPLAFEKGESILIVDASNQKLRIAGVFQSKW